MRKTELRYTDLSVHLNSRKHSIWLDSDLGLTVGPGLFHGIILRRVILSLSDILLFYILIYTTNQFRLFGVLV